MPFDEYQLLESAINITEERDKKSLEKSLIDTLSSFITYDSIILLRTSRNSENNELEVAASTPKDAYQQKLTLATHEHGEQLVVSDEQIKHCIDNQKPVSITHEDQNRTLFPIIINNTVIGIIDIYRYQNDELMDKLINGFIRIYSNFLAIIADNEHDALTGLLNRKTFDTHLSELLSKTESNNDSEYFSGTERRIPKQDNTHHWFGILDIDHFKSINDRFGHVYGDEVLLLFADLMRKTYRSSDLLFRYGGEEFVVVLSPVQEPVAQKIFERFRKQVEDFDFPQVGHISVSIGTISINEQEHPATLLENADQALYFAKGHGRNQIQNYNELITSGILKARQVDSDIELF